MSSPTTTLPELLTQLQISLSSAEPHLPNETLVLPPDNGISLLDTKTELFLSYLQGLVFLILLKLQPHSLNSPPLSQEETKALDAAALQTLAEHRLYLEKGVRPLESRLQYQIEKVTRASEGAQAAASTSAKHNRKEHPDASDDAGASSSDDEEEIDELAYRPNTAVFLAPPDTATKEKQSRKDGIYRPPKITPTSMPTTTDMNDTPDARRGRAQRPLRAAAVDDYIATEMADGPAAEPSVGSTITKGGQGTRTDRERRKEEERTRYEENNFMRLPGESKKEKGKRKRGKGFGASELGLESLGEMGERVSRAVGKGKKRRL